MCPSAWVATKPLWWCDDNREGTLFSWLHIYIYVWYIYVYICTYIHMYVCIYVLIRKYILYLENIYTNYKFIYGLCEIYLTFVEYISANWKISEWKMYILIGKKTCVNLKTYMLTKMKWSDKKYLCWIRMRFGILEYKIELRNRIT